MAINFTPKERDERIKLIGDFALETHDSTREIAEFFSKSFFKISHVTVHTYLKKYAEYYPEKKGEILEIISNNKPDTINDEKVKIRVLTNAKYLLEGYTVEEISNITKVNYWTVYRDLVVRLEKLDEKLYENIKEILEEHKRDNLR